MAMEYHVNLLMQKIHVHYSIMCVFAVKQNSETMNSLRELNEVADQTSRVTDDVITTGSSIHPTLVSSPCHLRYCGDHHLMLLILILML